MSMLRPLRILLPLVAVGLALLVFLSIAFVAFSIGGGTGPGGPMVLGGCDAGLSGSSAGSRVSPADLTPEQRQNANVIVSTARSLNAPPRAWVIALATAMQESNLRNIPFGDRDSEGLFQQRPSQGWGTPAEVSDPVHATTAFIQRLLAVPGWDSMALTDAAQIVQRTAFPDAYRQWEGLATQLVTQLGQVPDPVRCAAPVTAAGVAKAAIDFALAAVGKPYVWGATGPDTYDCSGLMLRAFQKAGVNLPRVSREQFNAGGHVAVRQAQPGDLLFLATDPNDPATIHHVMLYMGDDRIVEAPYTGASVRVEPAPWTSPELVPLATRPGTAANWS
jgi:hypothetical protein